MFLELEENKINIWEAEISDYEEYWGIFDDINEIKYVSYEFYTLEKSAENWWLKYEKLRKNYRLLYEK